VGRHALALAAVLAVVGVSLGAGAQTRFSFLVDQLKNATDFRLRTQAALALGGSDDPSAVQPLCQALDDSNDSVRSAAAAALGKLKNPAGGPCLKNHMDDEANPSVLSVMARSTQLLQGAGGGKSGKPRPPGPTDAYYVAIGPVTDKTGRSDKSVGDLVASSMQDKLLSLTGFAVAPTGEAPAIAKKVLDKYSLKGFLLQARVEPPKAAMSGLSVEVRVTLWTYPGRALQGEFSPKLTMSGASVGDRDAEDNLIKMAIERAIESFAKVATASN
jgi:hypothetical protein